MKKISNFILKGTHERNFLADLCFVPSQQPQDVVIYVHGFKGFKDWGCNELISEYFAEQGLAFAKFNFAFNGTTIENPTKFDDPEAFGNNNFSKEMDDLGVVIDWIFNEQQEGLNVRNIFLIGHSRGGGIALLKTAEDSRIKKVCTWASVCEYGKFWKHDQMEQINGQGVIWVINSRTGQKLPLYKQLYEDYEANMQRLHIPTNTSKISVPLLIIHGTKDDAVPLSAAEKIRGFKPDAEMLVIDEGDHVFGARHPWSEKELPEDLKRVCEATLKFFKK